MLLCLFALEISDQWRRHHACGSVVLVRYADDSDVGVAPETDAVEAARYLCHWHEYDRLVLGPTVDPPYLIHHLKSSKIHAKPESLLWE